MIWPFTEIKRLKAKIADLESRPIGHFGPRFDEVAKKFDAKDLFRAIKNEAIGKFENLFRDHIIDSLTRIDFGSRKQTRYDPLLLMKECQASSM